MAESTMQRSSAAPQHDKTDNLSFQTPAEFCANRSGMSYLIKGHVPKNALMMVFGQPGHGKTFFVLDQALSVAAGLESWHGEKLKRGNVLYLTGEGRTGLRHRIAAWSQENKVPLESLSAFRCAGYTFDLNDSEKVSSFIKSVKDQGLSPDWIIFDTLIHYLNGDENKAEDARAVIAGCDRIMKELGCALTLIHHSGVAEEAQKRPRGSSAFRGAMDIEILVQKLEGGLNAEQTKNKDGEVRRKSFMTRRVELDDWTDEDGDPVSSLVLLAVREAAEEGMLPVPKKYLNLMDTLRKCCEAGLGELTERGVFKGAAHTVWRDFYCDPAQNTRITSTNDKKNRAAFEAGVNALLKNGNIEIANAGELRGDQDKDRRIYTFKGKYDARHFAEYAAAAQEHLSSRADEMPAEEVIITGNRTFSRLKKERQNR